MARDLLVFLSFCIIAAAANVFAYFNFYRGHDAERKRRLLTPYCLVGGAVLIAFIVLLGLPWPQLIGLASFAIFIVLYTRRVMRFCDSCGAMLKRRSPFRAPETCAHCGARVDGEGDRGARGFS